MSAEVAAAAPAQGKGGDDPKLAALRKLMAEADGGSGVDAYIVPTEDPHMSEYPPDCHARREFISGFTGSAGTVVVTRDQALLWTDGRYWLQGAQQLGPQWTLMKGGHPATPELPDWLAQNLPKGGRVGIDPYLHTMDTARRLATQLAGAGHTMVPLQGKNLVDVVWGDARPAEPMDPVRVHDMKWAGASVQEKLVSMRADIKAAGAGALIATMLDEVAWLFNLRGNDVSFNPVFVSYGLVTPEAAYLFVEPSKVPESAAKHLEEAGVTVKPYAEVVTEVQRLAKEGVKLWVDPTKVSYGLYEAAKQAAVAEQGSANGSRGKRRRSASGAAANGDAEGEGVAADMKALFLEKASPVYAAKAVKNQAELDGMREAHLRDGAALANFLSWLEAKIAGGATVTECEVDEKLNACRAEQEGFFEPSFPTIAGANGNGAIIHYRPEPATCGTVDGSTLLLLDSGGQYDCGTTDITRTMHFGEPSAHQKRCYTRVLQGHIALDSAVFPEGTPGLSLDTLARLPLWTDGLNYRHGTGHGVGAALNVHEGPQSISTRYNITVPLQAGMIVSNEPGYYEDGAFGIRIENLVTVDEAATAFRFGGQTYFKFSALTMCPIETKLIDTSLTTDKELEWINTYHKQVFEAISPRVTGDALAWLERCTQPLARAA